MTDRNRNLSFSITGRSTGIFRAQVTAVGNHTISVKIPEKSGQNIYEDVPFYGNKPSVDDEIIVGLLNGDETTPVAIITSGSSSAVQGDIQGVVAGTNLNGGGTSGTVTLNLDDAITLTSVTANLFGPQHITVKNTSGGTLAKGSPVYATGSVGASGAVEVQASRSDTGSTMPALGLLDAELANNAVGSATVVGVIREVDTSSYTINDSLYVALTGGLTTTRPSGASELVQKIGRVVRVHATTGEILVLGAGRSNDVPNSGSIVDLSVTNNLTPTKIVASTVTVATDDLVLITDTSDSDNAKKVTAQSIADLASVSPAGSDTQVQFNNSGSFGASSNMVFDGTNLDIAGLKLGGTAVTSTATEINLLDGVTAGTISASKAVVADSNSDVATTGDLTAKTGGADGGLVLGQAFSTDYVGLRTAGMAEDSGDEYILISDGGNTYVSAGNSSDLYLRAGGNSTSLQIHMDSSVGDMFFYADGNKELGLNGTRLYPTTNEGLQLGYSGQAWDKFWLGQGSTFSSGGYWTLRSRDSDRQVMELVSSERFKKDIVDLPLNEAYQVLDARVIKYRALDDDASVPLEVGLSAESLHNAGYEYAVRYDEGHWGTTPRSIYYEYLTAPLIAIVKDLKERIEALES